MTTPPPNSLDQTVIDIRRKFGHNAIQMLASLSKQVETMPLRFGVSPLDAALGGIPRQSLTLFRGTLTAGMTTIAYRLMSQVQLQGEVLVYLDPSGTYDGEYASACCGVGEEKLLHIELQNANIAFALTRDLISIPARGLIVLDMGLAEPDNGSVANALVTMLRTITPILPRSAWTVLLLLPPHLFPMCDALTDMILLFSRSQWLERHGERIGYIADVSLIKHPQLATGQTVPLSIFRNGVAS